MNQLETFLEKTWDALLSRDPVQIAKTYAGLDTSSQHVVLEHLKKMANEPGWLESQVVSAQAALKVLLSTDGEK